MEIIYKTVQIKTAPSGEFDGYANVFDEVDLHGDCLRRGTFIKTLDSWKRIQKYPNMYLEHDPTKPVGKWLEMVEDDNGLWVKGKLLPDLPSARCVLREMNTSELGLSVGINLISTEIYKGVRFIYQVDLKEISITHQPANQKARISRK